MGVDNPKTRVYNPAHKGNGVFEFSDSETLFLFHRER